MISHGNGPQVGLLSLQASAYDEESTYPFDVLGAQTEGMIGYLIEQELGNLLPFEKPIATILTMTEVDPDDPAMKDPTKFVGPVYTEDDARRLAAEKGWTVKPDGEHWRRVVPSPLPKRIFEIRPIKQLLEAGTIVICTGGGGIPTMYLPEEKLDFADDRNTRTLVGVEAVIDKDRRSARARAGPRRRPARDRDRRRRGLPRLGHAAAARRSSAASPDAISAYPSRRGRWGRRSRRPAGFARTRPGKVAVIGALADIRAILAGTKGTRICTDVDGLTLR